MINNTNIINFIDTDSYKVSHWNQYPNGTEYAMSYIESRGGTDEVLFFGLQYILKNLSVPTLEDIEVASDIFKDHYGSNNIFNLEGWKEIANKGYFPLVIKAVPEGTIVPSKNVLATIRNTEPGFAWLVSWFETQLLRVWYPTTVATKSYKIKKIIQKFLDKNGTPESIGFKLHDFGSRGVSSAENALLGGMSHLVNFLGTDTLNGIQGVRNFYNEQYGIGFSIPASEHSTITSWGKEHELDAFINMIDKFGGEGKIYACVSDSYNIWLALEKWKSLEDKIINKGGTLVIRPDSGDPVETPVKVVNRLIELFGYSINEKGYKVLPDYIRVIQGDGITQTTIEDILYKLDNSGISSDNIAFGMGGALLQNNNRDDFKFAMKMCAVSIDGKWRPVMKSPVTDEGKKSKGGLLILCKDNQGKFYTSIEGDGDNLLQTVFENSKINETSFLDIRNRVS